MVDSNDGYTANPDYFVALLWRQVVEGGPTKVGGAGASSGSAHVLRATRSPVIMSDTHRELRSFAACDPGGKLVVGVANMGDVEAMVDVQLSSGKSTVNQTHDQWVLEAGENKLLTRKVKLNGNPIASVGGQVPPLPPRRSTEPFVAPPLSVAFLRFEELLPGACRPKPSG